MRRFHLSHVLLRSITLASLTTFAACGGENPPVVQPTPPPPAVFPGSSGYTTPTKPPAAPDANRPVMAVPAAPTVTADPLVAMSPEQINQQSPLQPAFFAYDSDALDDAARGALAGDAQILKKYTTWVVSIEGHSDERGTAEYNLALGDRRALAAKSYLLSLGIVVDRLRTVSYGKEFPFDPGHDEAAWSKNRRAHFMVTSK